MSKNVGVFKDLISHTRSTNAANTRSIVCMASTVSLVVTQPLTLPYPYLIEQRRKQREFAGSHSSRLARGKSIVNCNWGSSGFMQRCAMYSSRNQKRTLRKGFKSKRSSNYSINNSKASTQPSNQMLFGTGTYISSSTIKRCHPLHRFVPVASFQGRPSR